MRIAAARLRMRAVSRKPGVIVRILLATGLSFAPITLAVRGVSQHDASVCSAADFSKPAVRTTHTSGSRLKQTFSLPQAHAAAGPEEWTRSFDRALTGDESKFSTAPVLIAKGGGGGGGGSGGGGGGSGGGGGGSGGGGGGSGGGAGGSGGGAGGSGGSGATGGGGGTGGQPVPDGGMVADGGMVPDAGPPPPLPDAGMVLPAPPVEPADVPA